MVNFHAVNTTLETLKTSKPDMIEVMPAIAVNPIRYLKNTDDIPIIAGGLIETREDIINAGETAVKKRKASCYY